MSNARGYGGGGGKGCGMGRGMGRGGGRGRGQAMGQGMRRGRGEGRRLGRGQGFLPMSGSSPPAPESCDTTQDAQALKAQAQDMMNQLSAITQRIAEIEAISSDASVPVERPSKTASDGEKRFRKMTAEIDQERCVICGLCVYICPEQAISMNDTVTIDSSKCTGCGSCINECPNEAISLSDAVHRAAS
jgi:Pyruvate/2-oxoacid:ferredoxin oxidoreductase delta subunit